jgi:hypothetical protein
MAAAAKAAIAQDFEGRSTLDDVDEFVATAISETSSQLTSP